MNGSCYELLYLLNIVVQAEDNMISRKVLTSVYFDVRKPRRLFSV